jgi:hypothetical protein
MNLVAVSMDLRETPDAVQRYAVAQEYPWTIAIGNREMLEAYRVLGPSIKFAVNRNGLITYQRGYGVGSADDWAAVIRNLVSS